MRKFVVRRPCFSNCNCILQIKNEYSGLRTYSNDSRKPNFFSQFLENIQQEMEKNKEMKESLKKFREEAQKLEHSDALKKARQKYDAVESETSKSSEALKEKLTTLKEKMQDALDEASKFTIAKKAGKITEELGKSAREAAETLSQKSQELGRSGAFQTMSQTAQAVKEELNQSGMNAHVYKTPQKLRKRKESVEDLDGKVIEPNTEATGIDLHKDSKLYQSWQNFKDNNVYVNKVLYWKMKYDESDNPVISASRLVTDRVTNYMGGMFKKTELSETLTEICKVDPTFDKATFLRDCEKDIIPNILEAIIRGDLEILNDWCHEAQFRTFEVPIKQAHKAGLHFDSKILDIDNVDLAMGKVMDTGPVLIISFTSQQILCVRDAKNNVVEGDPDKVLRVNYVWVLGRDSMELKPTAAWRLLELSASSTEQFV